MCDFFPQEWCRGREVPCIESLKHNLSIWDFCSILISALGGLCMPCSSGRSQKSLYLATCTHQIFPQGPCYRQCRNWVGEPPWGKRLRADPSVGSLLTAASSEALSTYHTYTLTVRVSISGGRSLPHTLAMWQRYLLPQEGRKWFICGRTVFQQTLRRNSLSPQACVRASMHRVLGGGKIKTKWMS